MMFDEMFTVGQLIRFEFLGYLIYFLFSRTLSGYLAKIEFAMLFIAVCLEGVFHAQQFSLAIFIFVSVIQIFRLIRGVQGK